MKIATYNDGSRDGQLVVVSRDLTMAHYAAGIAGRLQQVLDDWNFLSPQLEALSQNLNHGKARHAFAFEPAKCLAPLPRAYLFARCDNEAPTADAPPAVRLRRGDRLLGACDPLPLADSPPATRLIASLAAITGDLAAGTAAADALGAVRLLSVCASLVDDDDPGIDTAWPTRFAPVAVTPDELGVPWQADELHRLPTQLVVDGRAAGGAGIAWPRTARIAEVLARAAGRRGLRAGSLLAVRCATAAAPAAGEGGSLRIRVGQEDGEELFGAISAKPPAPG